MLSTNLKDVRSGTCLQIDNLLSKSTGIQPFLAMRGGKSTQRYNEGQGTRARWSSRGLPSVPAINAACRIPRAALISSSLFN